MKQAVQKSTLTHSEKEKQRREKVKGDAKVNKDKLKRLNEQKKLATESSRAAEPSGGGGRILPQTPSQNSRPPQGPRLAIGPPPVLPVVCPFAIGDLVRSKVVTTPGVHFSQSVSYIGRVSQINLSPATNALTVIVKKLETHGGGVKGSERDKQRRERDKIDAKTKQEQLKLFNATKKPANESNRSAEPSSGGGRRIIPQTPSQNPRPPLGPRLAIGPPPFCLWSALM